MLPKGRSLDFFWGGVGKEGGCLVFGLYYFFVSGAQKKSDQVEHVSNFGRLTTMIQYHHFADG